MTVRFGPTLASLVLLGACGGRDEADPRYRVDTGSGVALFYREPRDGPATMDAASAGGTFALRKECLVVEVAGENYIPVFPAAARFDQEAGAIIMGNRRYALGRPWRLEFASAGDGALEGLADGAALPEACPKRYFHFGGIASEG